MSIIMPVYNASRYMAEAILSVQKQSYTDWELILIDDCSTDGSLELATSFEAADERIKSIVLQRNSGPAVARNMGIKRAKGRIIAFLDSDDIWEEEKLTRQVPALIQSEAAVVYSSYTKFGDSDNKKNKLIRAVPKVTYAKMLSSNFIGLSTALYDTHKVGKVLLPQVGHEDYALWLTIFRSGHFGIGIDRSLASYRIHSGSVSSNKIKAAKYHWRVLRTIAGLSKARSAILFLGYAFHALRKQ